MAKSVKTAATEEQLGLLHKGVTKAFTLAIAGMVKEAEQAEEDEDLLALKMALGNVPLLSAAAKWVNMNEIVCAVPEEAVSDNKLKANLEKIKAKQSGNIANFKDYKEG